MKKLILVFTLLVIVSFALANQALITFQNSHQKPHAIDIKENLGDHSYTRPDPSRAYDWYEYCGIGAVTSYFSGYEESSTLFQLVDFSLTYPATIEQVSTWFYDGSWDFDQYHFKIYDSDQVTVLYESGDLTAVHYVENSHTLPIPLVVTGDFYVSVVTDPRSATGCPYVLGANNFGGNTYSVSGGTFTLSSYEMTRAVYLEGTIPAGPVFSVDPESYHFTNIEPNDVFTQIFTISNLGSGTINIANESDITLAGDPEFTIVNVVGVPATIPTDVVTIEVQYAPTSVASHSTVLSIVWTGGTRDIATVDITGDACIHPANDECINAEVVSTTYPATGSGSNECAYVDCPGVLDWRTVWYEIDLPNTVNDLEITICAVDSDPTSVGIVVLPDCANCNGYILRDGGLGWIVCTNTFQGYNMIFTGIIGPTTVFWPANLIDADGGIAFEYEINVTEGTPPWDCEDNPPDLKTGGGSELEPNDDCMTANEALCEYAYCGDLTDVTDLEDWWYVDLTDETNWTALEIRVFANDTPGQYAVGGGLDTAVELYWDDCTTLAASNDDYNGTFPDAETHDSQIDYADNCFPPLSRVYIRVLNPWETTGPYLLVINCLPCEPTYIEPPEVEININYGPDEVEVTWDAKPYLNYNVYRSTNPYSAFPSIGWTNVETGNVTGVYTESATGTKYFYVVTANN